MAARAHFLVVAGADTRIDPDTNPSLEAEIGQSVQCIDGADGDSQLWLVTPGIDDVAEISGRRVDGCVVESLARKSGRQRPVEFASRGTLRVEACLIDRFEDCLPGVSFHCIAQVRPRKCCFDPPAVVRHAVEIDHVQRGLVVGSQPAKFHTIPVSGASDRRNPRVGGVGGGRQKRALGVGVRLGTNVLRVASSRLSCIAHDRSVSSRLVASNVVSSTSVATTAGL